MIDITSLSAGWIAEKRNKYSKDPSLILVQASINFAILYLKGNLKF